MKYQVSSRANTWYLHVWKYHRCYGYIINHAFHTEKLLKWNGLVFHWCLYNKYNVTRLLGDTKFLFLCWKNISLFRCTHLWNIFQRSKRNFVSLRGHVISTICEIMLNWLHNLKRRFGWGVCHLDLSNLVVFKSKWFTCYPVKTGDFSPEPLEV